MSTSENVKAVMRDYSLGVLAQGLTFSAALLPIFLGLGEEIVTLVWVSGIATLLVHPASLGAYSVYASIRSDRDAAIALAASLWSLCGTAILLIGGGLIIRAGIDGIWPSLLIYVGLTILVQGLYFLLLAGFTRVGSFRALMVVRLVYGGSSLAAMAIASTLWRSPYSLVIAAIVAYTVCVLAAYIIFRGSLPFRTAVSQSPRAIAMYMRRSGTNVSIFFLTGFSSQSAALTVGLLGPLAVPWAIAIRVCNGFQTVGAQLIAPRYDIRIAAALRVRNGAEVYRAYCSGTVLGAVLGLGACGVSLAVMSWNGSFADLSTTGRWLILVSLILYWGPQVTASVVEKYLTYGGHNGTRFRWEAVRISALGAVVLFFDESSLLMGLSIVMSACMAWFIWSGFDLARKARRRAPDLSAQFRSA